MLKNGKGYTVWLTGLSASGKSTISNALQKKLMAQLKCPLQVIDGDYMRETINKDLGYTRNERNIASERIAHVSKLLNDNGVVCIVSNISQDNAIRKRIRKIIKNFVLIFVDTPFEVCAERCYKGHYQKALEGTIQNFVGLDEIYEPPDDAEIIIDTCSVVPEEAANSIINYLKECRRID